MKNKLLTSKKFEYKWVIVAMCILALFSGLGFCSSAKSIYIAPITEVFGFSRSAFTAGDSIRYITTAIVTIFFDRMVRRFGTKKLFLAGLISYALFAVISAYATNLFGFYVGGVFLGLGVAWSSTTMMGVVINKWFDKSKGTVLGAVLASNGLGSAIAVSLLTPVIYEEGNPFGFRKAYLITAVLVVITMALALVFYKDKEDAPNAEQVGNTEKPEEDGPEFSEILKSPWFYTVIGCLVLYTLTSVTTITTPHFTDIGFDATFVSLTLSISLIGLAVCKVLTGIMYDRFGLRVSTNICLITALISKVLLLVITANTTGKVLTVLYCILISFATPIETVMLPLIALDLFGQRSFAKTLSITSVLFTIGHAVNSPLVNIPFDLFGSYRISFIVSVVTAVVMIAVMNLSISKLKSKN